MNIKKPTLVHVTSSLSLGGAETVLFNLVRGLQQCYNQHVISLRDGPFNEQIRALGVTVLVIAGNPLVRIIRLWRELDAIKPDGIHALLWSANFLARLYAKKRGVPLVCALHSPFNANTGNSLARTFVDRCTACWADCTIFVSEGVLRQATITPHVPHNKRIVISNGIAIADLQMAVKKNNLTRAMLGFTEEDFIIGTVGRLVPVKNHELLIQLVDCLRVKYPQVRLIIVGTGHLHDQLQQQVTDYGLSDQVRITAGVGAHYYKLLDCFVQPSFTEGLSMALLEAMAFKVPVLISSTTDMHDIVQSGKTGYLFHPLDLIKLTQHVENFIDDKNLRKEFAECAYQTVMQKYTVDRMVESYRQVCDQLIKKSR